MNLKNALKFYNVVCRYNKSEPFWENEKGELECFLAEPFRTEDLFADDWGEHNSYTYSPFSLSDILNSGINVMRPIGMYSDKIIMIHNNKMYVFYLESLINNDPSTKQIDLYSPTPQELVGKWIVPDLTPYCKELLSGFWPFSSFESFNIITERK